MDIQSVVVGSGSVGSLLILKSRSSDTKCENERYYQLPIKIGNIEAATITTALERDSISRPLSHDLMADLIGKLGGRLLSVRIMSVEENVFYAQLELVAPSGARIFVDSRPSDALALGLRMQVPLYVSEEVLDKAALPDFISIENEKNLQELADFHSFVDGLQPEDFSRYLKDQNS